LYGDWIFALTCPWCHSQVQLVSVLEEEHCAFAAFIWLKFLDEVELHPSGMCVKCASPRSQQSRRSKRYSGDPAFESMR
jgi:hypothetical protein